VSRVRSRGRWSPRVYYIVALVISFSLGTGGARGQVDLTAPPSMIKGAPAARVTIVEFSDYQ
jgi:hypothetical protein